MKRLTESDVRERSRDNDTETEKHSEPRPAMQRFQWRGENKTSLKNSTQLLCDSIFSNCLVSYLIKTKWSYKVYLSRAE